ncbi:hypothetical protein ACFYO0_07880 [Streptomyces sp. NPDC006365]|uniref:hypothetical protein n=1 Tax=Streptomyces sp. NPDC006365 TaxID=3364744 RepID=UPI0036AC4CB7
MRKQVPLFVGGLVAAALPTACGTETRPDAASSTPTDATSTPSSAPSDRSPSDRSSSDSDQPSSQADIRPTTTPREGDCVGSDEPRQGGEVWVVDCANRNAVARVTRLVPNGKSDLCIRDDYTGFDFRNEKPSLCLMLYGKEGNCYSGFDVRVANGPRVECTDLKAVVRLERIVTGSGPDACRQSTSYGDPNAAALFYSKPPDFNAKAGTFHDLTYCLASPNS